MKRKKKLIINILITFLITLVFYQSYQIHKLSDLKAKYESKTDVVFLHFDELDGAGHGYGFSADVEEYRNTLTTIDGYIEDLFNIIESKRVNGEDWIIFIISDHGGAGTGHGDADNPHINQTVFYAQHPNINFTDYHTTSMADLAPTILDFLGVSSEKYQCIKDGVSIIE